MDTNIALAALPPPANLDATNVAESDTIARLGHYGFSWIILPSMARTMVKNATTVARVRLVETAFALEQFHSQNRRLPENLGELCPRFLASIPADPFDGAPLRYHQVEKGYVIYSVDRDGHDDGGREKPFKVKSNDKTAYDITFTVERR